MNPFTQLCFLSFTVTQNTRAFTVGTIPARSSKMRKTPLFWPKNGPFFSFGRAVVLKKRFKGLKALKVL